MSLINVAIRGFLEGGHESLALENLQQLQDNTGYDGLSDVGCLKPGHGKLLLACR